MNIKELKELVKMLDGTDIVEFIYENEGNKVVIKKGLDPISHAPRQAALLAHTPAPTPTAVSVPISAQNPSVIEDKNEGLGPNQVLIVAPMVGTFYRAPSPDSDPYVQAGQNVEAGQVVCIIEAMKLMNEIESEWNGKVVEILAQNGQPVEYGQPLLIVEKN
jgi:acetyl-CoA carboxylase biotin carboxyl carrier protein